MSEIRIPLENHGPYGQRACVRVELVDTAEGVLVIFDAEKPDDAPSQTARVLTAAEARALAAAILHYAAESER